MANTRGEKELRTDWPFEDGLTARTESQTGRQSRLIADGIEGIKTTVLRKDKKLMKQVCGRRLAKEKQTKGLVGCRNQRS